MQRYVCQSCEAELGDPSGWEAGMIDCPKCGQTNVLPRFGREGISIVLSCDFCGTDWDEIEPMVEGHRGSILCLRCLEQALKGRAAGAGPFRCTMCIREDLPAEMKRWSHPDAPHVPGVNREAVVCDECIEQAAKAFSKDPDVDWKRP